MLTTLRRKQKGIMIVVAIVVIIAFAFLYSEYDFQKVPGLEAFSLDGREYRASEVQAMARSMSIAAALGEQEFINALEGFNNQNPNTNDAVISLLVLRKQAEELGVRPSEDEIAKFIKNHAAFQSDTGSGYDAALFGQFNERYLSPQGLTIGQLSQIIGDVMSYEAIRELLGANIRPSAAVIDEYFARDYTEFTALRLDFPRDRYTDGIAVTGEEVKTYYEQNKATLLSDPQRRIEYAFFPKPKDPPKPEAPAEATGDAPAKDDSEADEAERKAKLRAYSQEVAAFARDVLAPGSEFADVAKTHGIELKSTPAFSYDDPPAELANARAILNAVFTRSLQVPISDPIDTPDGYYLFNLLEIKEPEPLTLEDATKRIEERLTESAVTAKMNVAVSEFRTKLLEKLKEGTGFADAALTLGQEVIEIPAFSRSRPPYDQPDASVLAPAAARLKAGEISAPLSGLNGSFLVYVKETTPLADETAISTKKDIANNIRRVDKLLLFAAWFQKAKDAAGVKQSAEPDSQGSS